MIADRVDLFEDKEKTEYLAAELVRMTRAAGADSVVLTAAPDVCQVIIKIEINGNGVRVSAAKPFNFLTFTPRDVEQFCGGLLDIWRRKNFAAQAEKETDKYLANA